MTNGPENKGTPQQENPRVTELTDELYRRFASALPHLPDNGIISANLLALARELAEKQATLEQLAVLDSLLPGFFKHSYFLQLLDSEAKTTEKKPTPDSALIVLDFDKFRDFNNRFGHPAGDRLLKSAGKAMCESLRPGDTRGRIGGDELAVIVHRVAIDGAVAAARRLQAAVIRASQEEFGSQGWSQRISVGICLITPGHSGEVLHGIADKALYASKGARGDRISIASFNPVTKSVDVRTLPLRPTISQR